MNSTTEPFSRSEEIPIEAETPIDAPVTMWTGKTISVEEAKRIVSDPGDEFGNILHRYGDWCVTDFGVECLSHPYWIEWDRIGEDDWVEHLARKTWVNRGDVERVFAKAKLTAGADR